MSGAQRDRGQTHRGQICRRTEDLTMKMRDNLPKNLRRCTGKGIRIAVIDSGLHVRCAAVKNVKKKTAFDMANGHIIWRRNTNDENGHGTKICEIILSLAPDAELYIARIFGKRLIAEMDCLFEAMRWAIRHRVHIINISPGSTWTKRLSALRKVCEEASGRNIFIISSMDNGNRISYPAYFKSVFCAYNLNRNEIKRKKQYLLGFGEHARCPNSFLVPLASGILSLIREAEPHCSRETAFERLCTIIIE